MMITSKQKILLISRGLSGSNPYSMICHLPDNIKEKYQIIFEFESSSHLKNTKFVSSFDFVVVTHGNYKWKKPLHQKVLDTWHGFGFKGKQKYDRQENKISCRWQFTDYVLSYGSEFTDYMGLCINQPPSYFRELGAPRNDFLSCDGSKLYQIFPSAKESSKKILFAPTYRKSAKRTDGKVLDNIFGRSGFSVDFLHDYNIELFVKPHPNEEKFLVPISGIHYLTSKILTNSEIDLYEILPAFDLLITDYSSIWVDYLLLNRPIIYNMPDYNVYSNNRGLLKNFMDEKLPGVQLFEDSSINDLYDAIISADCYQSERKEWLYKTHKYQDFDSSKRVWNFIDEEL